MRVPSPPASPGRDQNQVIGPSSSSQAGPAPSLDPNIPDLLLLIDQSRVYLPGSIVDGVVRVPVKWLGAQGGFISIVCKLRGEVHSWAYSHSGSADNHRRARSETVELFTFEQSLWDISSPSAFPTPGSSHSNEKASAQPTLPPANANGTIDLAFRLTLPTTLSFDFGRMNGGPRYLDLPPTWTDSPSGVNRMKNYVTYYVKVTGARKGTFQRNVRKESPFTLLPFAPDPQPHSSLPAYNSPPGASVDVGVGAPQRPWISTTIEEKIKKGLVFERGMLKLIMSFPQPNGVGSNELLPFTLQVEVSAKGRSTSRPGELVDGSLLPTLPLAHGQAGSSEYAPSLELVRLTEAVAHRHHRRETTTFPLSVHWTVSPVRDSPQSTSLPGWSDPIYRVDPSPSSTGASDSFGRWIRTAHLSGSMTSNCVPTFHTPTLNVSYVLQVRWPLHGLANGVKEVVATWVGHSGIGRDAQASAQAGHALPALPAYENERANGTGPVGAGEARKEKGEAGRGDPFPSPFRSP